MVRAVGRIAPFNPGSMDPKDLETLLFGRKEEAARLEERIAVAAKERIAPPQQLIIGPRGYGKTHLLHVIHNRLDANKALKNNMVIAILKEEEHVHNYLDFLRRILEAIKKKHNSDALKSVLDRIYSDPSPKTIAETEEFFDAFIGNRLLVVMVENLGDIFDGMGMEGQKRLRAWLQESRKVSLFATAQRLFEPHMVRTMPFYGFFDRTYLESFDEKEARLLMKRLAGMHGDKDLQEFIDTPLGRARVSAARELTGGNPRLINLLSGFLNKKRLEELTGAFVEFVETSLTPYYQEQLNRLTAPIHKRIVEILCEKGDGRALTVKEIARSALTTSQSISKQLAKMTGLGVLYSRKQGRATYYGMAEPLWRVSIEVKTRNQGILRIVVEFLKLIKTPQDLFSKLAEKDAAVLQSFQKHWSLALKESLGSLGEEEKDSFQRERLKEIACLLPDDPAKAERLSKVLADTGDKLGKVLWMLIRVLEDKESPENFEIYESEDEFSGIIFGTINTIKFFIEDKHKINFEPEKEKRNLFLLAKWAFLAYSSKKIDNSILEEIDTDYFYFLYFIFITIYSFENKKILDWLLKISEEKTKNERLINAINFDCFHKNPINIDIWFSFIKKVKEEFFWKLLSKTFFGFLFASEKENKLLIFFEIISKRLTKDDLTSLVLGMALQLVMTDDRFSSFWQKNRQVVLDAIFQWKNANPDFLVSLLTDAEAFAKGDADALAAWPVEVRKQFEKAKAEAEKKKKG